jgi:hypothetical protein
MTAINIEAAESWKKRWPAVAALLGKLLGMTIECDGDEWLFVALTMAGHVEAADELKPIWRGKD